MRCFWSCQIVDSGLDETSCFFIDEDGEEVEHGYFFDEIGFIGEPSIATAVLVFAGGYFPFDLTRRKVTLMPRGAGFLVF